MKNTLFISFWLSISLLSYQSRAQRAVTTWPVTRLDSVASVEMPYEGTLDETEAKNSILGFGTTTSDNSFDVVVYSPHLEQSTKPGKVRGINVDKFLAIAMQLPNDQFVHPKFKTSFYVTVPTAPGGRAMHQVYSGFDDVHQSPAALELTWVMVGQKLYVFRCSYQLPAEQGSTEDMQHFFTTIHFNLPKI